MILCEIQLSILKNWHFGRFILLYIYPSNYIFISTFCKMALGMSPMARQSQMIQRLESVASRDSATNRASNIECSRRESVGCRISSELSMEIISNDRETCSAVPPKNRRLRDEKVLMQDFHGDWQTRQLILTSESLFITRPGQKLTYDQIDLVN